MKLFLSTFLLVLLAGVGAFFFYKKEAVQTESQVDSIKLGSTLDVAIEIERECRIGDFDILIGDLKMSGKMGSDLLLSIEPIVSTGSKFKPISVRLSAEDIEFGYKKSFDVALTDQKEHLGVFLCRDRQRTGSCNEKAVVDYGKMEESLQRKGDKKIRNADKIYFFQYLYAENNELQFLTANVESLKEAFIAVDRITEDMQKDPLKNEIRKKAKNLFDSLGSYVVTKKPEKSKLYLQAMLAKMDRSKCSDLKPNTPQKVKIIKGKPVPKVFKDMGFGQP